MIDYFHVLMYNYPSLNIKINRKGVFYEQEET